MRRTVVVCVAVLALVAVAASIVQAQGAPPTVTITANPRSLALRGAEAIQAGPTRFDVRRSNRRDHDVAIAALRPGRTVAEFERVLRRVRNPDVLFELVTVDGGVGLLATRSRGAVTFALKPNTSYVVIDTASENPRRWPLTSFTVGAATGTAVAPRPDATVRMVDFRFRGASTLPRSGTVQFQNRGRAPHFAIAFPLRRGADSDGAERAIRRNQESRFNRFVAGPPSEPQTLVTTRATNDNELRFDRPGRYLLVCFFNGHNQRGMYKTVRVR